MKSNLDLLQTLEGFNSHHTHSSLDYITLNFGSKEDFDLKALEKQIGGLLWEKSGGEVLRVKGILAVREDDFVYSLQA